MPGWDPYVELIRHLLFVLAHVLGGSFGGAIVALSIGVRLFLLPLTVRAAVRAREQQARLAAIKPQLDALRKRHARDPQQLMTATQAVHQQHGISLVPKSGLLTAAIQLPIGAGLYQAIRTSATLRQRFAWIADLSHPDGIVTALVVVLATLGAFSSSTAQPGSESSTNPAYLAAAVSGLMTLWFVYRLSAGVGLYWAASSGVGLLQAALVKRMERERAGR